MQQRFEQGKIDILASHQTPHRIVDKYRYAPISGGYTPQRYSGTTCAARAFPNNCQASP